MILRKEWNEQFEFGNVFNSDQSDFQLEIHYLEGSIGRSLSYQGMKKVERVVQSAKYSYN